MDEDGFVFILGRANDFFISPDGRRQYLFDALNMLFLWAIKSVRDLQLSRVENVIRCRWKKSLMDLCVLSMEISFLAAR